MDDRENTTGKQTEIVVSGPCYDEIRNLLVKQGTGGTIVERPRKTIEMGDVTIVRDEAMTIDYMEELGRAYRCIRGLYGAIANGEQPNQAMLGYHSPTIAAAHRFVHENSLEGAGYFIGKHVDVLRETLAKYKKDEKYNGPY